MTPEARTPHSDQLLERQRAAELVTAPTAATHWLQFDLVGEDLPQHLAGLDRVPPEDRNHISDARFEVALKLLGVQSRDNGKVIDPLQGSGHLLLPCLLGAKTRLDLVANESAVGQRVEEPPESSLDVF